MCRYAAHSGSRNGLLNTTISVALKATARQMHCPKFAGRNRPTSVLAALPNSRPSTITFRRIS